MTHRLAALAAAALATSPGVSTAADLQRLVDRAIDAKAASLRLPAGAHRIARPLVVVAPRGLAIDARGARIVVTEPTSGALHVERSRGVLVRGLSVDYSPLPFTQGRIVGVDARRGRVDMVPEAGYGFAPGRFPGGVGGLHAFPGDGTVADHAFLAGGRIVARGNGTVRWQAPAHVYLGFYRLRPGDRVALGARWSTCAVQLVDSVATPLVGVSVAAAPGCAIGETRGGGTVIRARVAAGPPPPGGGPRLLSTNRDGIHSSDAAPGPTIADSVLSQTGDDGINVESRLARVAGVSGRRVRLRVGHGRFTVGDAVRGYDPASLRTVLQGRVRAVRGVELTLDRVGGLRPGAFLVATRYGADARIRRTRIDAPGRCGILVRGTGAQVRGNVIASPAVCGIWIGGEVGAFEEGDFASDVLVAGNRVTDSGRGRDAVGDFQPLVGAITVAPAGAGSPAAYRRWDGARPVRRIRVADNVVQGAARFGILVSGATDVALCGNALTGVHRAGTGEPVGPFRLPARGAIAVRASSAVRAVRNTTDAQDLIVEVGAPGAVSSPPTCPPWPRPRR